MKKRGFTLIELLAVIVILAVIALIATPIVMNVIENSRKGAAERSAENYFDAVETAVMEARLDGTILADGTYTLSELEEKVGTIEVSGNKPTEGSVTIKDGIVVTDSTTTLKIGDYTVSCDENGKIIATKGQGVTEETFICEKTGEASKTVGAEYTCHLDTDRTFYVLENIESSENISLIMDRNFTDGTVDRTLAWCIDGGSDNTTCQNINSKEEGTPLKHIQDTFGNNVEVSFPTKDQVTSANNGSTENLPQWLHDYLDGQNVYGYWIASPYAYNTNYAHLVKYDGCVSSNVVGGNKLSGIVFKTSFYGVRPVITISKSELG